MTATRTAAGTSVNARLELANVEGSSLTYRRLAAPAGRATAQFVLTGAGRSASALAGSLSGTGSIAIERARISGLRPDVFAVVARTDDLSRTNDTALKSLVEATLAAGELSVDRVEIPFNVKDGRLTANTAFGADYVKAAVSGGYDLTSDQVNIRVNLMAEDVAMQVARPEIQLLLFGTPDGLQRNVDVSSLSSWLALRAIENETHRLNQLEREGTQKPPDIAPLPPAQPNPSEQGGVLAAPTPNIAGNNPQVTPLPPPITIKPAPGAIRQQRPRPPMVLTPGPSSLQ